MQTLAARCPNGTVFHFSEVQCNSRIPKSYTIRGGERNLVTVCTEIQRTANENKGTMENENVSLERKKCIWNLNEYSYPKKALKQ